MRSGAGKGGSGPHPPRDAATAQTGAGGAEKNVRLTAWVRGHVQGVGMRWWIRSRALELGLAGWARNCDDGRVEVVAEGPRERCEALLGALGGRGTPGRVVGVTERWSDARGVPGGFVER
jgi:acylphosphatase